MDNKSPEAFRTISEVAETLDVPPHVLRFWETRFAQVKPVKRGGGRRYYRPEDIRLLRGIRSLLYDDGMTIKGVQKILRERGIRHVIGLGTLAEEDEAEVAAAPVAPVVAPEAPPAAAPAARPSRGGEPAAAAAAAPQGELFADGRRAAAGRATSLAELVEASPALVEQDDRPPRVTDKAALRDLLVRLEALRVLMMAEPRA